MKTADWLKPVWSKSFSWSPQISTYSVKNGKKKISQILCWPQNHHVSCPKCDIHIIHSLLSQLSLKSLCFLYTVWYPPIDSLLHLLSLKSVSLVQSLISNHRFFPVSSVLKISLLSLLSVKSLCLCPKSDLYIIHSLLSLKSLKSVYLSCPKNHCLLSKV